MACVKVHVGRPELELANPHRTPVANAGASSSSATAPRWTGGDSNSQRGDVNSPRAPASPAHLLEEREAANPGSRSFLWRPVALPPLRYLTILVTQSRVKNNVTILTPCKSPLMESPHAVRDEEFFAY